MIDVSIPERDQRMPAHVPLRLFVAAFPLRHVRDKRRATLHYLQSLRLVERIGGEWHVRCEALRLNLPECYVQLVSKYLEPQQRLEQEAICEKQKVL